MRVAVSEPVLIRDVFCGTDGTMFLTDVGCVFACGCNRDNKLALNNRYGIIRAIRNIFTKVSTLHEGTYFWCCKELIFSLYGVKCQFKIQLDLC